MRPTVFRALRDLAYEQAGIVLGDEKEALVSARVGKRLRALHLGDEEAYLDYLRRDTKGAELVEFLDVISTNYTSFFREPAHFERFQGVLAKWSATGQRRFRVWSAAASTGEEPYSIALVMAEVLGEDADWRILATDLSTRVLAHAKAGRYAPKQVETVPPKALARAFERLENPDEGPVVQVRAALKAKVAFVRLNLARPPFPMRGPFDVIFCRNVMIYFDNPVRQGLIREAERLLRPGGLLLIGHSESLNALETGLRVLAPSVYQRPEGP